MCLVYPFVTATNFGGGRAGQAPRPGMVPDTAKYAAGLVVAAIETEDAETFAEKTRGWGPAGAGSADSQV